MSRHIHKHAKKPVKSVHLHIAKNIKNVVAAGLFTCASVSSFAEGNRTDYDLDDDGLIEINDLNDLDQIRHELDGYALYGSSEGCPESDDLELPSGCFGFELTTDLDFDTNGDGQLDHNDQFWNDGKGWIPIENPGSGYLGFRAIFEGNGHAIRNLFSHGSLDNGYDPLPVQGEKVGLFARLTRATVQNLALTGSHSSIQHPYYVAGAVAGYSWGATVKNIFTTVPVNAGYASAVVGESYQTHFENIFVSGTLTGTSYGVVYASGNNPSTIKNTLSVGSRTKAPNGYPFSSGGAQVTNSYWSTELTGIETDDLSVPLQQLQCTNQEGEAPCSIDVYKEWPVDSNLDVYWDMGNAQQLPALVMFGKTYRDSDGDGRIDSDDDMPLNFHVYEDADNDGAVDVWHPNCDFSCRENSGLMTDQLPQSSAGYLDADFDGLPEQWGETCDEACQQASGLTLDTHPLDQDNDGILDSEDTDDNGDGLADIDSDSDGLIEIKTLAELNAIRYQLDGRGLRMTATSLLNTTGCPRNFIAGKYQRACSGFKLMNDLDFDTNGDGVLNQQDDYWNDGKGWLPLGYLDEDHKRPIIDLKFNGHRKSIKNLYINRLTKSYAGLFAYVDQANINNLHMEGHLTYVRGHRYTGMMVGKLKQGYISHAYISGGKVDGYQNYTGAIAGDASSSTIRVSTIQNTEVKGTNQVGGYIGQGYNSTVEMSVFDGKVEGGWFVGGIVGHEIEKISDVRAKVEVHGKGSVGGLIGNSNSSVIDLSFVNGLVTGENRVGGVAGHFYWSEMKDIASAVDVISEEPTDDSVEWGTEVGGLVGRSHHSTIENALVLGQVVGNNKVGGVVGETVHSETKFVKVLSLSAVKAQPDANDVGGIVGSSNNEESLQSTYWSTEATGQGDSGISEARYDPKHGLTLSQTKCPTTANNTTCTDFTLFEDWIDYTGYNVHWLFGSSTQLPQLHISGATYGDRDLDGHIDDDDQFPDDKARYLDSDGDGYDDAWPKYCDAECQNNSGRRLDDLPNHKEAYLDTDRDGRPDAFLDNCNSQCQLDSGLVLDEYLNDADNDGVIDSEDPNIGEDDGAPIVNVSSEHFNISVDNEEGTEGKLVFNQAFMDRFSIQDAVDRNPTFYLIGVKGEADPRFIEVKLNEHAVLPAGRQELVWGVEDESGNRSEIVSTFVNVYPRLQFKQSEQTTAERSDATIDVIPTADMPVLQATVLLKIDTENTTLLQSDLNEFGFPMDGSELLPVQVKQVSNSEGELSWIGQLVVPLVQDGSGEPDKQLVVTLDSIEDGSAGKGIIEFNPDATTHTLTVNDSNLPPEVSLTITQAGQPTNEVKRDQGMVTVTATAVDPDVNDQIAAVKWQSNDTALVEQLEQVMTWEFDPSSMNSGEYWIRFTAIDNQEVPQSGIIEIQFMISPIPDPDPDPDPEPKPDPEPEPDQRQVGSSSSSGGGASVLLFLLTLILIARRNSIRKYC